MTLINTVAAFSNLDKLLVFVMSAYKRILTLQYKVWSIHCCEYCILGEPSGDRTEASKRKVCPKE